MSQRTAQSCCCARSRALRIWIRRYSWGRVSSWRIEARNAGTISIHEKAAVLWVEGEEKRKIPIIDEPYVNYEAVVPDAAGIHVRLAAGELLRAIDLIGEHLEPRHPVWDDWTYLPQVEIQFAETHGTLSLITSRDMGYNVAKEKAGSPVSTDDAPWARVPYWRFAITVEGQVNLGGSPDPFRTGVNHGLLVDVVSGLEAEGDLDVFLTDPLKALLFVCADHPDRKAILMPMRMEIDGSGERVQNPKRITMQKPGAPFRSARFDFPKGR